MLVATKAKGTKLEHEFKEYFEKWGYYCIRSAGSFDVDLIALKEGCLPLIVNVKWLRKYCGPAERLDLVQKADKAGGLPILAYKQITKGKKNGVRVIEILNKFRRFERGDKLVLEPLKMTSENSFDDWLKFLFGPLSRLGLLSGLHPDIHQEGLHYPSLPGQ